MIDLFIFQKLTKIGYNCILLTAALSWSILIDFFLWGMDDRANKIVSELGWKSFFSLFFRFPWLLALILGSNAQPEYSFLCVVFASLAVIYWRLTLIILCYLYFLEIFIEF